MRQLRYVVATADARSFSRAASTLNVKQITLSKRVQQLEDRLGIRLFDRSTRGAEPTDNGRPFIEQARRIVTDIDNLVTTACNVSYGLQGRLTVGYCTSIMSGNLKLAFIDYLSRFPEVQFDGIEGSPERIIHGLQSQTMDLGIAPIGMREDGLVSKPLWSERLFAVFLEDNDLLSKDRIYWQDLRREVFVLSSNGIGPTLGGLVSARLTEQGFRPAVIYQDTTQESVLSMIAANRFISITTEASQGLPWQNLHFREIYDVSGPARLDFALYSRQGCDNPALQRFFELIDERYPG